MTAVSAFIEEQSAKGTTLESGCFTISRAAALEKLKQYRNPSPDLYILQFITSACLNNARRVEITTTGTSISFLLRNYTLSRIEIENWENALFAGSRYPLHLSELAVGIEAALRCCKSLTLSALAAESWRMTIKGDDLHIRDKTPLSGVEPALRITLHKPGFLSTLRLGTHPELKHLTRTRYAESVIILDGHEFHSSQVPWSPCLTASLIGLDDSVPERLKPFLVCRHPYLKGHLYLDHKDELSSHELLLVHNGITYRIDGHELGLPLVGGVIHYDGFQKDLSRSNLVRDEVYERVRSELYAIAIRMVMRFCHTPMTRRDAEKFQHLMENLVRNHDLPEGLSQIFHERIQRNREFRCAPARKLGSHELTNILRRNSHAFVRECLDSIDQGDWETVERQTCELVNLHSKANIPLDQEVSDTLRLIPTLLSTGKLLLDPEPPTSPIGLHRQALIWRFHSRMQESRKAHALALLHPDSTSVTRAWSHRYCAELLIAEAQYQPAWELYGKALQECPDSTELILDRALLSAFLGPQEREWAWPRLLQISPHFLPDSSLFPAQELSSAHKGRLQARKYLQQLQLRRAAPERELICRILDHPYSPEIPRRTFLRQKLRAWKKACKQLGHEHAFTNICLKKCVQHFRVLGFIREADRILCRAHLIQHLLLALKRIC